MKGIWGRLSGRMGLSRFLQWRFNTILLRLLPFRIARVYIGLLGRVYFLFNREEKEEIKRNLCAVIRRLLRTQPVELIIRRTFRGIYAHYHEKLFTAYASYSKVCRFVERQVQLEGQHLLEEALSQGRGLILVTGHFGAVEFLPTALALNGFGVTMVVRFKTEQLKRTLKRRAARLGITLLDATEGEGVMFSALRALKSNRILITECDEFEAWRPCRTRRTQFLGYPSPMDRTLDLFQRRHDSPVIMGLVIRKSKQYYEISLHSLENGQFDNETIPIAERALRVLESYILETPEQWYQWKEIRIALGTKIFEETSAIHEIETDRSLPVADSATRTF